MSILDAEALKRQLSDALAAYQQDDLMRLDTSSRGKSGSGCGVSEVMKGGHGDG